MKKLALILLAFVSFVFAKDAARYKDSTFKVDVEKNVVVTEGVPHLSEMLSLASTASFFLSPDVAPKLYTKDSKTVEKNILMDIYKPAGDAVTKRPVVLVAHGGAFVAGRKEAVSQKSVAYCDSLAARGFVTASLGYRLGVEVTESKNETSGKTVMTIDSADFARTVYRGLQDTRAAVRYLRANAKKLGIDPTKIYMLGNSAGAILTLENIYAQDEGDFPEYLGKEFLAEGLDFSDSPNFDPHANAGVALWGAIHNLNMIGDNKTPVLMMHGMDDDVVFFDEARPLSDVASMIPVPDNSMAQAVLANIEYDVHTPTLYGSSSISEELTKKGVEHETYFVPGVGHEFYNLDEYTEIVQQKAFDFLYRLAIEPSDFEYEDDPEPSSDNKTDDKKADEKKDEKSNTIGKPIVLAHASSIVMGADNMYFTLSRGENVGYAVYDMSGKRQLVGRTSAGSVVDLSSLNNGVYMLLVKGERTVKFGLRK